MISVVSFLGGLIGLVVGGHLVVDGAANIGRRFGLSPMVIGLTIVAVGTSAPEMAVVLQSVAADDTDLAVGSVVGSNIANVLLVLGFVALLGSVHVVSRLVRWDIPIMIGASIALLAFGANGVLSRLEGALMFTGAVGYVIWTLRTAAHSQPAGAGAQAGSTKLPSSVAAVGSLLVGIVALAIAARFVVSGAEHLALSWGVPELVVGLTVLALGTSAPEIVTTVIAAVQGRRELAIGNAVGSNIFNILFVLGLSSLVADNGIGLADDLRRLDLPVMVAVAVACLPVVFWDNRLDRWEGGVFVAYYVAYVTFLVLDATGHQASNRFAFVLLAFVMPLTVITFAVICRRGLQNGRFKKGYSEADDY